MKNKNVIDLHAEHCGKDNKVVNGRECRSALPLVNGLRGAEPEDVLEILHRQTGVYAKGVMLIPVAVMSMTGIRFISFTLLFRRRAGKEPAQLALKL